MKAKKHLGQHFLIDKQVVDQIIELIVTKCNADLPLLEIGPGPGVLTNRLNEHFQNFKAVELDSEMVSRLKSNNQGLTLIHEDFLRVEFDILFDEPEFNIAGNFPYNISSQIIFKILENVAKVPVMVGMFQKEVAERICADPGTKKNGIITIQTQLHYEAKKVFDIPPQAFDPPPRVNSAIIILERKKEFDVKTDKKLLKQVLKASFGQRRKKLRNTLKAFLEDLSGDMFQRRPEELGVSEFLKIVELIKENK